MPRISCSTLIFFFFFFFVVVNIDQHNYTRNGDGEIMVSNGLTHTHDDKHRIKNMAVFGYHT